MMMVTNELLVLSLKDVAAQVPQGLMLRDSQISRGAY